ncbi:RICIN domain-containing protein [Nostoc sp.]|uniref:RICIN domain-containing protein n=1 Tax=Nostoc sp. TaxID=1180 RepID=UPI002FFA2017
MAIQEGKFYRLTTAWLGSGQSLDLDASTKQPKIAETGDYSGQYWKFTSVGEGYYRLTTKWLGSEQSLDLDGSTKQLKIAETGDYTGQYWKITPVNDSQYQDYYRLTTQWLGDGKSLDLDASTKQPKIAETGDYTGQYWKFTELSDVVPSTSNTSIPTTTIAPPIPPISDNGTINTEAGKTYKVQITVNVPANIGYNNSFGIFAINDDGSTAGVKPGDPNYAATVVKNRIPLPNADQGSYQKGQTFKYDLPGGPKYSVFLIANGTPDVFLQKNPKNEGSKPPLAYFFNTAANPDGKSHVKVISPNEYGFEDIYGGGDQDFDDLIVKLETLSVESKTSNLPTLGKYYYLNAKHSGKALAITGGTVDGGKAVQWNNDKVDHFKWLLEDAGNGYFYLIVKSSAKALTTIGGNIDGAQVVQWTNDKVDHFKWLLEDAGDGYFYLINKASGKALAVDGGLKTDGTNVIQWTNQKVDHFKWKFEVV